MLQCIKLPKSASRLVDELSCNRIAKDHSHKRYSSLGDYGIFTDYTYIPAGGPVANYYVPPAAPQMTPGHDSGRGSAQDVFDAPDGARHAL